MLVSISTVNAKKVYTLYHRELLKYKHTNMQTVFRHIYPSMCEYSSVSTGVMFVSVQNIDKTIFIVHTVMYLFMSVLHYMIMLYWTSVFIAGAAVKRELEEPTGKYFNSPCQRASGYTLYLRALITNIHTCQQVEYDAISIV